MLLRGLSWLIFRARPWIRTVVIPALAPWFWRLAWTYAVLLLVLALFLIVGQVCRHGLGDYPADPGSG